MLSSLGGAIDFNTATAASITITNWNNPAY